MNIKTRLSFQFSFLVVIILLFFSILAYYFSFTSQRLRFREDLLDRAKNTAILLINVDEVDSTLLKKIHQSTISWKDEEIVLTDSELNIIYSNKVQLLSEKIISMNVCQDNINYFSVGEKDGVCYRHMSNKQIYYVYVMAFDKSRKENLKELREILFWSILFSTWLSIFISYFFSKNSMQPISRIIRNVKAINSSRLNERLDEGNKHDEIAQLAITFNELLSNLEVVFKNQEEFVSNASHEFRTPLAVMIVEADYLLSKTRKQEEYTRYLYKFVDDLKRLNALLNSLLELAQINRDIALQLKPVRIDEIIYNAVDEIKTKYEGRKIVLKIQYPENENALLINGNQGILTIAFKNLIDNACKFSDEEVLIEFLIMQKIIKVSIEDKGIGIPHDELDSICSPFKRASNVKFKAGFGIGLSLVSRILELHNAVFIIHSIENKGTSFEISFNRYYLPDLSQVPD